jgi:hypothetical protein
MGERRINRRQLLKAAGAIGAAAAVLEPANILADEGEGEGRVTWDLVNVTTGCVMRGGEASAMSTDNSSPPKPTARITLTGHGTFPNTDKSSKDVTGGGKWTVTSDHEACFPGHGEYRVIELLSWHPAAGTLPLGDCTGDKGKPSSGLAILRVLYSNGRRGTVTVSCHLPAGPTPACMFEGITATMDYEDFWMNEAPVAGKEGNRTLFHVSSEDERD